jgi:hypothetical protein
MKHGIVFCGSKNVIPSQKPGEKKNLISNRELTLRVYKPTCSVRLSYFLPREMS